MQRFCLTLDLRPDPSLIAEYVHLHQQVWPEVLNSIRAAGVLDMQIFIRDTHLFMIMDTTDEFSMEAKAAMDASNPKVIEWEALMGRYQVVDLTGDLTRKWQLMESVFQLNPLQRT